MFFILLHENSSSFRGTLACFRYRRNPNSSGLKTSRALPTPPSPRAVRPTLWMYSCNASVSCVFQTVAKKGSHAKVTLDTSWHVVPWDRPVGRTAQSSPPRGCPDLWPQRPCTAKSLVLHCRTGRRSEFAWLVSVSPERQITSKHDSCRQIGSISGAHPR